MKTLEFLTVIENGVIHLPEKYKAFNNVKARVVVVSENENRITKKARLLANFKKLQLSNVFESISSFK